MTNLLDANSADQVSATPAADAADGHAHFAGKLACEADPADVAKAVAAGVAGFTLVDCRPVGNYDKAHLPGAVSLPWQEITADTVADLPEGLLVTYCWGPSCNAATKGAAALTGLGRQVKEMIGGIEYWIREGHPTEGKRPVARGGAGTTAGRIPATTNSPVVTLDSHTST